MQQCSRLRKIAFSAQHGRCQHGNHRDTNINVLYVVPLREFLDGMLWML